MNLLESVLHEVAALLQAPVVAALVLLLVYCLLAAGGFARESLDRRQRTPRLLSQFAHLTARSSRESAAAQCEIAANKAVARLQLVARAGPTLGLMATLIPMGPALLALADGDVAGLSRSLVVAFTATVVGLLIGLLCTAMASARRHWYAGDLAALDAWLEDTVGAAVARAGATS